VNGIDPRACENPISVIYDGECAFCIAWLRWLQKKIEVEALSYHEVDLGRFQLTKEQCSQAVYVIANGEIFSGADAISILLKVRGNLISSHLIHISGPVGRFGYRWVASHRNTLVIKMWTRLLIKFVNNSTNNSLN